MQPEGRLSLRPGQPVMVSSVTSAATLYYVQHVGAVVPSWNGVSIAPLVFTELAADLSSVVSGAVYDVVASTSVLELRQWQSHLVRGFDLSRVEGILVDPAGATYLGTIFAPRDGSIDMNVLPPRVSGGTNNMLCVWNAYHRQPVIAVCQDKTPFWTYATAAWRPANGSPNNRITWIDGLGHSPVFADWFATMSHADTSVMAEGGTTGIAIDATNTAHPITNQYASNAPNQGCTMSAKVARQGLVGAHYAQATEHGNGTNFMIYGNTYSGLFLILDM